MKNTKINIRQLGYTIISGDVYQNLQRLKSDNFIN